MLAVSREEEGVGPREALLSFLIVAVVGIVAVVKLSTSLPSSRKVRASSTALEMSRGGVGGCSVIERNLEP